MNLSPLFEQLPSLGISGLLFVMWWQERLERVRVLGELRETARSAADTAGMNERLLDVVRTNTEALTALREELRAHRAAELQWLGRLSEELQRIQSD